MYKQLIIAMSPGKFPMLLLRAVEAAKELGMEEYKDYFLIYDACRTELEKESPEGTLTCIGFRPMEAEEIKKYQLYH